MSMTMEKIKKNMNKLKTVRDVRRDKSRLYRQFPNGILSI